MPEREEHQGEHECSHDDPGEHLAHQLACRAGVAGSIADALKDTPNRLSISQVVATSSWTFTWVSPPIPLGSTATRTVMMSWSLAPTASRCTL